MALYNIKKIISKKPRLGIFLTKIKMRLPYPLFLLIHITLKCNRYCSWCYQRQDLFYKQYLYDMSIEAFDKILSSLKHYIFFPKPHIHLFGGEPLLHPEFPEFLKICKKYNYSPTITTNGEYLNRYIDVIKNSSIAQLNISLNGTLSNSLEANYKSLMPFIEFLTRRRNKIVNLNFALTPYDYHLFEDTVLFFNKRFRKGVINTFTCQHYMFENNHSIIDKVKKMNLEIIIMQIRRLKKINLNFKLLFLPNIAIEDLEKYYYSDYPFRNKCYLPWAGLSIYPDLAVTMGGGVFCCNKIVGNLNTESLQEVWKGNKINRLRSDLLNYGLNKQCNRCCQKLYY